MTLKLSLIFFGLLTLALADDDTYYFKVLIREIDNPAGTLLSGQSCSDFGFVGIGCNTWIQAGVVAQVNGVVANWTLNQQINTRYETLLAGLNFLVADENATSNEFFEGFTVQVRLATESTFSESVLIDNYTIGISTSENQGIYTYTSQRLGTLPTSISIAWSTNIPTVRSTTPASTTEIYTESTTEFTGSTTTFIPTTTPKLPVDCSEIEGLTEPGNQTVYPDGLTPVGVYCDVTSYGVLTVIQSRDSNSADVFNQTYDGYIGQFGNPLKVSNYWLGLENMYQLTNKKSYNLLIDLCCGTTLVARQLYHNFQIGNSTTNYTLNASADIAGIGLDYSNNGKDIGAPFSTHDTYNQPSNKDSCDEFEYEDDNETHLTPYGGWWYGSCGNNLNGALLQDGTFDATTCSITSYKGELGVNLRTTTGTNSDGWDVDLVSYNRVRMAVFTFDTLLVDKTDSSFCQ